MARNSSLAGASAAAPPPLARRPETRRAALPNDHGATRAAPIRVAFVVNGSESGAMGERARSLAAGLSDAVRPELAFRHRDKVRAIGQFFNFLRRTRPDVVYVVDMGFSGVIAARLYAAVRRTKIVIDTGDEIFALVRSAGGRGRVGEWATWLLERWSFRLADAVVVRGTLHERLVRRRGVDIVAVIPDGVDCDRYAAISSAHDPGGALRADGVLSVGMLGSSVWSERLGICYGWDLIEAIRLLRDAPVRAVIVGDGSGIDVLRARCREYDIEDRVTFVGRVPAEELPGVLAAVDVWTSTQTNDTPGQVRTTGKLPLYMAAGRFVLASRVGEASLVLDDAMLVDYEGVVDTWYPARLAARIRQLLADPSVLSRGATNARVARERFDYHLLARRVEALLASMVYGRGSEPDLR